MPEKYAKAVMTGVGSAGRTSIINCFLGIKWDTKQTRSIGSQFIVKRVRYQDSTLILQIWPLIYNQKRPLFASQMYYRGASVVVIVYSVIDRNSFINVPEFVAEAHKSIDRHEKVPIIILGNKVDLRNTVPSHKRVTTREGEELTQKLSYQMGSPFVFMETSAKTGENIKRFLTTIIEMSGDYSSSYY